jgi:hypothetical protein
MLPGIARAILECYTEEHALGNLKIILLNEKSYQKQDNLLSQNSWTSVHDLQHAYAAT